MTAPVKGSAVVSKAGRDKGLIFAVLSLDDKYALLADGKLRRLERPKKKSLKHIAPTAHVFNPEEYESNGKLREALKKRFSRGSGQNEEA